MKTASRLICTIAAAGMACAPIAANANTRAGETGTIYTASADNDGSDSSAGFGQDEAGAVLANDFSGFFVALLVGAWVTGIIFIIADDGNNQSPGGN